MIKEFFEKHSHLIFTLEHLCMPCGMWRIRIYDVNYGLGYGPIFTQAISDDEADYLKADFEAAIMTPVIDWWETSHQLLEKNKGGNLR